MPTYSRGLYVIDRANRRLTFSWMTPLMKYGHKVYLTESDLWGLRSIDRSSNASATFAHEWEKQLQKKSPSVTWAILRAHGKTYAIAGVFKACQDILAFVQPQLLRKLLSFVNNFEKGSSSPVKGFAIAGTMFLVSVIQTSFLTSIFSTFFRVWYAYEVRIDCCYL